MTTTYPARAREPIVVAGLDRVVGNGILPDIYLKGFKGISYGGKNAGGA